MLTGVETDSLRAFLNREFAGMVKFDVALSRISRWEIGGVATAVIEPTSVQDVARVRRAMSGRDEPLLVVGDMSNVLFDSAGFSGVILRIGDRLSRVEVERDLVRAEAGVSVPALSRMTADAGLSGLEHAVGIPGTLGGLVTMNGGSQRRGIGLNVERVLCIDSAGADFALTREECAFGYRSSALQTMDAAVVGVELRLEPKSSVDVHRAMDAVVESRASRFPEELPNCGSTFLSDPRMYDAIGAPGYAIESLGLKGLSIGGACVSPRHANFIVNVGGATSDDVLNLIHLVREAVQQSTGFSMDCEVRYVSPGGKVSPAHEVRPTTGAT